ncbi:hypothetical protein HA514_24240 (plasmid) [Enterobacter kobei]|nr:hypothetical protein HA514_24240 [Enterobacter kobei]
MSKESTAVQSCWTWVKRAFILPIRARDLSQAVKELWAMPPGSRAIVSICADGGQGTVALLERG